MFAYLLEDGTGRYMLEDGTGVYLLEDQPTGAAPIRRLMVWVGI